MLWRDSLLVVNAYPYAPAESQHTVIASAGHLPQSFSTKLLGDMIDLQGLLGPDRMLHYNGIAGNSEQHLSWQASKERLLLERVRDAGRLPLEELRRDAENANRKL